MWIIAAAAAGLVGTVLALILGQYRPEFRMLITAAVTLLLMAMVLEQLSPVLEQLRSTMELTGLTGDYAAILFKGSDFLMLSFRAISNAHYSCHIVSKYMFRGSSKPV